MRRSSEIWSVLAAVAFAVTGVPIRTAAASPPAVVAGAPALEERAEQAFGAALREPESEELAALFRQALDEAEEALRGAPGMELGPEAALFDLIAFYDEWIGRVGQIVDPSASRTVLEDRARGYAAEMLALLRGGAVGSGFWDRLEAETSFSAKPALLALWLGSDPRDPAALAALAAELWDPSLRAALFRAALDARPLPDGDPRLTAWLVQERLTALFDLGLAEAGLAELAASPAPVRELLLSGATGRVDLEAAGLSVAAALRDVRLDLAAAHALAGEPRHGAEILARVPPPEPVPDPGPATFYDPEAMEIRSTELRHRILWRYLAEAGAVATPVPPGDPFNLFLEVVGVRHFASSSTPLRDRLAARLAEITGYPQIAHHLLAEACRRMNATDPKPSLQRLAPFGSLPYAALGELATVLDEVSRSRGDLEDELSRLDTGEPWVRPASCSLEPWSAPAPLALPPGSEIEPLGRFYPFPSLAELHEERGEASRLHRLPSGIVPPPGLAPVALFQAGGDTLLLAYREGFGPLQDYGYWIVRSIDGGASWGIPHQTGLVVGGPFEVNAGSPRNRWARGRLELEVWLEAGGEAVGLPELEAGSIALLSVPVEELLRDTDGDTLSDLEERVTYTDPERRDSDRDGVDDGLDRLPLETPVGSGDSQSRKALTAAIERTLPPWNPPARACDMEPVSRRLPPQATVLVIGEGMPLDEPAVAKRVSVIAEPPGATRSAYEIQLFAFDRDRSRALVFWRELTSVVGTVGSGRYLLAQDARGWRVTAGFQAGGCTIVRITDE